MRLGELWRRSSLRLRLAMGLVLITAIVLVGCGFAVTHALRGFLVDRLDQQVGQFASQVATQAPRVLLRPGDDDTSRIGPQPNGAVALLLGPNGGIVTATVGTSSGPAIDPQTTRHLIELAAHRGSSPFSVRLDGAAYRATVLGGPASSTIVAALPLKPVSDTLHRLLLIEIGVGLAAIVGVGVAGSLLVRFSLRPLDRIAASARGIVASDLSSPGSAVELRVPDAPPGTEIGQLSSALNAMLQHIEAAFDARTQAEQKLRQFVADASHELRTPLSSIRGYAELFRRGAETRPDDVATAMRRIEEEGRQMSVLVDDLLLLARLDQGRPLERHPVDLAALCADAATDSRVVDARWPVVLDVPPDPLLVMGDQLRLRQVIANVVRNARIHTPVGTTITIAAHPLDASTAALTVQDNGPGIPPEALPHVFDRFYRADVSRSRASGGSGLGLSIVQAIVRSHDGEVRLSSTSGGTTVEVRLPLREAAQSDLPSQPVHSGSSAMLQNPGEM